MSRITRISKKSTAVVFALLALGITGNAMANHPSVNPNWGTAVHDPAGTYRVISIDDETRHTNVKQDETVRFTFRNGKSFEWRFDTLNTPIVDLGSIAPEGVLPLPEQKIRVYVSPLRSRSR